MAFNAYELTTNGELNIAGNINTRLPVITEGLICHFPFDGRGGSFDGVGGNQTVQNVETGVNLIEAMQSDWRDPNSWSSNSGMSWDEGKQALKIDGYHNSWLNTPIVVDVNKHYQVSIEVMEEVQSSTGLYLGGLCNNASGQRVTPNYDYSYGANAQPATGVWTKYCTTRYGTGNQVDRTSTTFANVSGWMGTNTGVTDKLTKYYYYGGLFNYSSGGVMYIRNLNITIVDADTSNTTITNDGIAIEEATTNLFNFNASWRCWPSSSSNMNSLTTKTGEHSFSVKGISNVPGAYSYIYPMFSTTNNIHSWSVTIKNNHSKNLKVSLCGRDGSNGADLSSSSIFYIKPFETQRIKHTDTIPVSLDSITMALSIYSDDIDGYVNCEGFDIQLENKSFATSFVNGSRGNGNLTIPFDLKPPYTINLFHKPHKPLSQIIDQSTSPMIFQMSGYHTNASISYWNYNKNLIIYIKGDSAAGWTTSGSHYSFADADWDNKEHMYSLVAVNNTTFKVYVDGNYAGERISSESVTKITDIRFSNSMPNAIYRKLSIYNRILSDDEIKQLAKPTFELKPNGDLIVSSIISKPIIPDDVYYFPLGSDGKDEYKVISPTTEVNTTHEDGAVWVGHAANNMLIDGHIPITTSSYGMKGYTLTGAISEGETCTVSLKGTLGPGKVYFGLYNSGGSVSMASLHPADKDPDGVFRKTFAWRIGTSSNTYLQVYHMVSTTIVESTIDWIQLERTSYSTPFMSGSRGLIDLEYNFNSSIGLDWSSNWTIAYWKKPVGTATANALTGYSIESLGSNSNSVGGGYIWWGKDSSVNTIASSNPLAIDPTIYFGNWQLVVLRKNGTTLTINTHLSNGTISTRTTTVSTTLANYYVCHHGYDFKFGWDNTAVANSWFKDLIVAKRVLTDDEINTIYYYKNPMQYLNNGILQIKDSIKTKQVIT